MKVAVLVGPFVITICLVEFAYPQLGQPERGAQDSLRGVALTDDTRPSVQHPPAPKTSGPQDVVYLQRSARFAVPSVPKPSFSYEGPLLREIQRQAFLVAARDQLGLATRDAWLGDAMPTEGKNEPFEVVTAKGDRLTLEVRRGSYPAARTVIQYAPKLQPSPKAKVAEFALPDSVDHRQWLVEAERLSRGTYVEALRKCGFEGKANVAGGEAGVPAEIEERLGEMVFTSQFVAVRQLHELIRAKGESPARLGALVRGYANLGLLTEFHWHPMHKVFKARSLVYAQRMLAADRQSYPARWHRAYAFAATGLHGLAIEDLEAAEADWKGARTDKREKRPDWVDLIDAHCRFDLDRLNLEKADKQYVELTGLLRYLTAELSGDGTMTVATALELVPKMPECYRIHDGLCHYAGVQAGHQATTEWLMTPAKTLYQRLAAMPGLPESAEKIVRDVDPAALANSPGNEFDVRAKLTRALRNGETPDETKTEDAKKDAADKDRTRRSDAQSRSGPADTGEPSWAALGNMIGELSFVQAWRRVHFEVVLLGMPADQSLGMFAPLTADHPYAAFIEAYSSDEKAKAAAWKKLVISRPDGLELQEYPMCLPYYADHHRSDRAVLPHLLNGGLDHTARDYFMLLTLGADKRTPSRVLRLLAISPFSTYATAAAIVEGGENVRGRLAAWEKAAAKHPLLCKAFADRYVSEKRFDEAAKWAKAAIALNPDYYAYQLLAQIYWIQGHEDRWAATLEEFFNQPDYGLVHGVVCAQIARYYMARKHWDKAMRYAEGAADTYSAWGLLVLAGCYEGTHQWKEAEKLRKAAAERYPDLLTPLYWYCFCRRTGHGDLAAARAAYQAVFQSKDGAHRDPFGGAVFCILEKKPRQALRLVSDMFERTDDIYAGLHVAMLHDELGDAKERDAALHRLIERAAKVKLSEKNASQTVLAQLARMIVADSAAGGKGEIDLAAADKINDGLKASLRKQPPQENKDPMIFDYFLGRYLSLHGKTDEAIKHWKKCVAETETFDSTTRSIAGAELCDRGIRPESYKSLWETSEDEAKKAN
jgi:tetratricopeptide (TPR) repeat protein